MTNFTVSKAAIGLCLLCLASTSFAQEDEAGPERTPKKPYKVNYWISGGITLTGVTTNTFSHNRLRNKPGITEEQVNQITAKGVNRFDRWGLRQDPSKKDAAHEISDRILYSSVIIPFFLFLDRDIRESWLDITLMYAEAQAINSNLYGWSPIGPAFVERYRPAVYYPELPMEERNFGNLRNSFYSGHVSSTATATFFAAKVYADYHPGPGNKKYLAYGLACLPPAVAGYYRVKALKHFPSDVIVGGIIGASVGILIPELHRLARNKASFSAIYTQEVKGLGMIYRF